MCVSVASASDPNTYIIRKNGSHPPDPTRVRRDAVQSGLPRCAERRRPESNGQALGSLRTE